jgi:exodeoxyribonuclease III
MPIKLASWNVNSLKVRLPHLLDWLQTTQTDIVCLQETKTTDDSFPADALRQAGYHALFAGQKTYNGVAILLRQTSTDAASDVVTDLPGFVDEQRRFLALTVNHMRIVCGYFPNGQEVGSDKYQYKLRWLDAMQTYVRAELAQPDVSFALLGDFNIAPEAQDVYDPVAWEGQILCSEPERAAFRQLLNAGLVDAFRQFEQPERSYSWWDYRNLAFRRKLGLRIDHILLSKPLAKRCTACVIDTAPRRLERPSDHAPVIATLSDDASAAPTR